jgi:FkbM family methyltransferase
MKIISRVLRLFGHHQYIRFGVRDRVIRSFHNPDTAGSAEFVVPFFGATYRGNFSTFLDWSVYYYGAYAGEELRLIKEVLEPTSESVVFDVGANIGHHTLFMSRHSKQVFAFEPFEGVSKKILEKLNDNNITNVELCKFGLGENNSVENYYPPDSANTGTGSFLSDSANSTPVKLEIKKGDDFFKERNLSRLDFIKMDVRVLSHLPYVVSSKH